MYSYLTPLRVINLLLGKTYALDGSAMPRHRDRPRPEPAAPMSADDIDSAANVLDRKHQRGELSDVEFRSLAHALREERQRAA